MTTWVASPNSLPGTGTSPTGMSGNPVVTSTSEASTSTSAGLPGDGYRPGSWWGRREFAGRGSAVADVEVDPRAGGFRTGPERVLGLRKWEGRITEISGGLLTVELTPADHDGPELVADFDVGLLGPDSSSAAPGDILYLTTRTIRDASGYPYQTSSLKLRRPGQWGEDELREIQEVAQRRAEFFKGIH